MSISISELERIDQWMTAGPWFDCTDPDYTWSDICAMRNSFPVLLRIAKAAVEYHEARKDPDSSCSLIDARYSALIVALFNHEVQP